MLKTNLLYKHCNEYLNLFNTLKGGTTIDIFIDQSEKMIKDMFKTNNELNVKKLQVGLDEYSKGGFIVDINGKWITIKDDCDEEYYSHSFFEKVPLYKFAKLNKEYKLWEVNNNKLNAYIHSEEMDKIRGNTLEIFAEIFFNQFSSDPTMGVKDYTPVPIGDDFGADAIGVNANGDPCVIQVKYRKDDKSPIEYTDLTKPHFQGIHRFGFDMTKPHTLVLFTTSNKASVALETEIISKKLIIPIFRKHIATKVDNNVNFWKTAYEMVEEKLKKN